MSVFVRKIQLEFFEDSGLRGATVWFSDKTNIQVTPKDKGFIDTPFGRMRASKLAKDLLSLYEG